MSAPVPRSLPQAVALMLLLAGSPFLAESPSVRAADGEGLDPSVEYTLSVHSVWGSKEEGKSDLPRSIRDLEGELKRCTGKTRFRSSEEPRSGRLKAGGKAFDVDLPDGYKARWSITRDDNGRWGLQQTLINPKGVERSVRPAKSPVIAELGKIQKNGGTLILVVELRK